MALMTMDNFGCGHAPVPLVVPVIGPDDDGSEWLLMASLIRYPWWFPSLFRVSDLMVRVTDDAA